MKRTLWALALLPLAATAHAQRYRRPLERPLMHSATVDIVSGFQRTIRATLEPVVLGRFSFAISGEYTTEPDDESTVFYPPPYGGCPVEMLCAAEDVGRFAYGYPDQNNHFREWSLSLHGRWYPKPLSFSGDRQSGGAYIGEFIGRRERRVSNTYFYEGCPTCSYRPPTPADTALTPGVPPYYGGYGSFTQVINAWEPGLEVGIRVLPARHIVLDAGARVRVIRMEDYQSSLRRGDLDGQLSVALGIAW